MAEYKTLNKAVNFLLFQAIWFAAILGAANQNLYWCYALFLAILIWQLHPKNRVPRDCLYVCVFLVLGFLFDTAWLRFGLIEYQSNISLFNTAPNWILILWVTFALTLNHSMAWINKKPKLAYAFSVIGGTLSYFAGKKLGAIQINERNTVIMALGVAWLISISVALFINRYDFKVSINKKSGLNHG